VGFCTIDWRKCRSGEQIDVFRVFFLKFASTTPCPSFFEKTFFMKKYLLLVLLASVLATHSASGQNVCTCIDCPIYLFDFITTSTTVVVNNAPDPLGVNGQGLCRVRLHFSHEYLSDLLASVISPSGQEIQLLGTIGLSGPTDGTVWNVDFLPCDSIVQPDPGLPTTWANNAAWGIGNNYFGSYHPNSGCFEDLTGPVNGEWKLRIEDGQAGDEGDLLGFELEFCNPTGIICYGAQGLIAASPSTGCVPFSVTFDDLTELDSTYTGYRWELVGGTPAVSSDSIPTIAYTEAGLFPVTLYRFSSTDTIIIGTTVNAQGLPNATFSAQILSGNFVVTPEVSVLNGQVEYWIIDGIPTATLPYVLLSTPTDSVTVQLVTSNPCGLDTNTQVIYILDAEAAFGWSSTGLLVQFDNQSTGATEYDWIFGDGATSTLENPAHAYDNAGSYEVVLKARNAFGVDVISDVVTVPTVGTQAATSPSALRVSPNPARTHVVLHTRNWAAGTPIAWSLTDAAGQEVRTGRAVAPDPNISTVGLAAGVYLLHVRTASGQGVVRVVVF
jgi:PKD repeat protein